MGRFEGPQRSKDIKPKDSQGILAKLADSNLAKTIRAGTAAAMLYGAMPATEAEAAPKQRPLAAQTQKAKPGKAPESAKKASPADQLRERRQRVEREAAQMIAEKHALGQLAAENVPQEILEKISAAKNGRDLARISWSKDFDALGTNAQFAMLKYMNVSRFANQYETMDNIFSRLSRLPLTEETRDFALQVAPHVHPRDKDDTSYSFPVSSFMTGVLRKSMKGDEYRELRATTKAWAEKMIMTLAKNMPREELMDRVITSQYKYYPFHRVFRSDPHSIDVEGLMRKAYPLQTLNEISKVYEQKAEKNPHASEQSSQWFFNSRYWQYLLPEEQLAFVRANLPKPNDTSRDKMLLNLLDKRDALTQYSAKNYDDVLAEIGKADPNKLLQLYVATKRSANWGEGFQVFKKILVDPRVLPQVRVSFIKRASIENSGSFATRDELMKLVPPEELIVTRNREPAAAKFENPYQEMFYRQIFGNANIFDDVALKNIRRVHVKDLPKALQELPPLEVAQWQVMIARNLFFQNKEVNAPAIRGEAERIEAFRGKFANYPLLNHTIVASHEELINGRPRFGTPEFIAGVNKFASDTVHISPHIDTERRDYRTTRESLERAKREVLRRIVDTPAPLTFFADMHGGGDGNGAIYLSDGQIEGTLEKERDKNGEKGRLQPKETERTEKISAEALAQAFIERYKDPQKRQSALARPDVVIIGSCFSSNIVRYIAKTLQDAGMPIPVLIAMAEYGQVAFSHFYTKEGSDFNKNTVLQKEKIGPPTVGGVIEQTLKQRSSKPVVIVPDNKRGYMQLSDAAWFAKVQTNTA